MTNGKTKSPLTPEKPIAPRSRRWVRRAFITLAILVILVEILLRLVLGLGSPLLYSPDPACTYFPRPDQDIHRFFARNHINHFGMRSDEFFLPRPADHERILFIGDSMTYGTTYVDQSLIFTSRLAVSLPTIVHKPVDVLNISAGEWGIGNEVGFLFSRGTFDSNVVLLVLNTGDPSQPFSDNASEINYPTSRPWTAIGEAWSRYAVPRLFNQPLLADAGIVLPTIDSELKTTADNMLLLEKAKAFCQKSGALFGIVYVPYAGATGPFADRAQNCLAFWTQEHRVPFIDTSPALYAEKIPLVTFDGIHLRPFGDEIVAREITRQWPAIEDALAAPTTKR